MRSVTTGQVWAAHKLREQMVNKLRAIKRTTCARAHEVIMVVLDTVMVILGIVMVSVVMVSLGAVVVVELHRPP